MHEVILHMTIERNFSISFWSRWHASFM